ncbi:hypothetical protein GCM10010406_53890 [Streptomyces thermolineatus]|uniref:Integral membrane protein n=1 Tax=Streptomyces thermolineatus TaxID=44033 RepID=A0ABN3MYV1_9ACTN
MHGKPSSSRLRLVAGSLLSILVQPVFLAMAGRASADPTPSPSASVTSTPSPSESADTGNDACDLIRGPARDYCEGDVTGGSGGGGSTTNLPGVADPLDSLARACADAAAWVVKQLSSAVESTTQVDFTNPAFRAQYGVVFAATTFLTLVLWLFAVAKRAVRGIPLTEAISEAVGFLWLAVLASAFTPLVLYTLVSATDAITEVIAMGTRDDTDMFFGSFVEALSQDSDIGGGPIMLIVVSLVSIVAAGVLFLELFIRAALLYVGALLGVVVYSGLVDKNLWHHVRRWAGIMIAIIMVKPVIVIVLGLAGALAASEEGPNSFSAVVSGLAIILLAIFASFMIYRFVPGFGDDIAAMRSSRKNAGAGGAGSAAAVISSPAALVKQGINTHSARGGGAAGAQGGSGGQSANPVSSGIAAHSSRSGAGGGPVPAPAPRAPGASRSSGTPGASGTTPGGDRP